MNREDSASEQFGMGCPSTELPPLVNSVDEVGKVIQELKEQLTKQIRANEVLESDLDRAHQRLMDNAGEREQLLQAIESMEQEAEVAELLKAELDNLQQERDALIDKTRALSRALESSEAQVGEMGKLIDRFREERNDASREAASLEEQFDRAMRVVEELRKEIASRDRREEEAKKQNHTLLQQLQQAVCQRDAFKSELVTSRHALEEVHQSILAASRSQGR
jgi:chromosome segregation ATPase